MTEPRWLTAREERAWRGYMRMQTLLDLQIGRDLMRSSGVSYADYSVLASLSEAPDGQLRLIELAQALRWSKSRLSHHLDRMAGRGLVQRQDDPTNSRAAVVALTDDGLDAIRKAAPDHVESVRRHFIDLLTDDQIEALGEATETIVEHLADVVDSRATSGGPGDESLTGQG